MTNIFFKTNLTLRGNFSRVAILLIVSSQGQLKASLIAGAEFRQRRNVYSDLMRIAIKKSPCHLRIPIIVDSRFANPVRSCLCDMQGTDV